MQESLKKAIEALTPQEKAATNLAKKKGLKPAISM